MEPRSSKTIHRYTKVPHCMDLSRNTNSIFGSSNKVNFFVSSISKHLELPLHMDFHCLSYRSTTLHFMCRHFTKVMYLSTLSTCVATSINRIGLFLQGMPMVRFQVNGFGLSLSSIQFRNLKQEPNH